MGITTQFYAVSQSDLESLRSDLNLFQEKVNPTNRDANALNMDKAGMELLMVLGPDLAEMGEASPLSMRFRNIALLLGGGIPLHPDFDMGYGPSLSVSNEVVLKAISEFEILDFDTLMTLVNESPAVDFGLISTDADNWKEFHWPQLQNLQSFCEAHSSNGESFIRLFC